MKKIFAIATCFMLAMGAVSLPMLPRVAVVYAGDSDFSWSTYSKKSSDWWSTSEATEIADEIIKYQLSDGGWRKDMTNTTLTGDWANSTIDNNATWGQIRFLAGVYSATKTEKYKTSCLKGIDLLLNGQYDNGGWPQVFGTPNTYHAHITYNDSAMVSVLNVLLEVSQKSGSFAWVDDTYSQKAENAVDKGIECILNTQITIKGTKTAWGQQHDEYTLEPAGARAYELPSVCTSESAGIVNFLRALPEEKQSVEVIRAINAAVRWFDAVKIENTKFDWNKDKSDKVLTTVNGSTIWARFYDLENSQPLFGDRDGQAYTDVTQISVERRTGYSWYGTWCAKNIELGTLPEPVLSGVLIKSVTPLDTSLSWDIDTDVQLGDKVYTDRDVTYKTLPTGILGGECILTPCDAKTITTDLADVTFSEDAVILVGIDTRVTSTPSWLSGWTDTGNTFENSGIITYKLYSKAVKADETITLGANGQSSGCMGYTAFVVKEYYKVGDADANGTVNSADRCEMLRAIVKNGYVLPLQYKTEDYLKYLDTDNDGKLTLVDAINIMWS
ncbi:MAG: pectate lyase [Firmicutes bacterium]|nr:pectate lyase [Bacillota bacterium]